MKFALFLVCALVAVQGYQAHFLKTAERDDISDFLQVIVSKIKEMIANVNFEIPKIIQPIKDKINENLNKITEKSNEIKKKVDEIIQVSGDIGRKCTDSQRDNITALLQFSKDGINKCVAEAEGKINGLMTELNGINVKLQNYSDEIVSRTYKCVEDNKMTLFDLAECMRDQVKPLIDNIVYVFEEVSKTVVFARQKSQAAIAVLVDCSTKVQNQVSARQKEIFDSVNKCITKTIV